MSAAGFASPILRPAPADCHRQPDPADALAVSAAACAIFYIGTPSWPCPTFSRVAIEIADLCELAAHGSSAPSLCTGIEICFEFNH